MLPPHVLDCETQFSSCNVVNLLVGSCCQDLTDLTCMLTQRCVNVLWYVVNRAVSMRYLNCSHIHLVFLSAFMMNWTDK